MNRTQPSRKSLPKFILLIVAAAAIVLGGRAYLATQSKPLSQQAPSTPGQRNEVRREHLKLIAGAINRYTAEVGPLPIAVPAAQTPICAGSTTNCKKAVRVDLNFLANKGYLNSLPNDPVGGHELWSTGYTIGKDAAGKAILEAPRAEAGASIDLIIQ